MSDVKEWLKERRTIHDAATEGTWEWQSHSMPAMNGAGWTLRQAGAPGIKLSVSEYQHGPGNADAIVDAHNTLPALLTAVEKVLEQVEFMETDAENYLNAGYLHASEVLLENAGDLRQAIEGAIK